MRACVSVFLCNYEILRDLMFFIVVTVLEFVIAVVVQANSAGSSSTTTASRNALVTSLMVCCGFILCWSVNQIVFFLNFVGYSIDFAGWFYHFSVVLVFSNSCINPLIYAAKYREFQRGFRRLIHRQNQVQSQATATAP